MKIGDRVFVRGYIDEIRKDTVIVRNDGGYFGTILSEVTGELPSAQPERKKGRWIKLDMHAHLANHKCTACGQECYVPTCMGKPLYTYCPNCGAKMDS